ncbi:MAG: radical SAM/SPASM domain-containing protein [Paludibacter sp.]
MRLYFKIIKHTFNAAKYLSFGKIINLSKLYFSYLSSQKKANFHHKTLPSFISVEPYNFCQLKCPECPVSQRELTNKMYIDEKNYQKVVDELKETLLHIIFYFQGEPLINKNLAKLINYAHKAKIFTSTSTNAQLLNSDKAREIVLSGLDKLIISIDGSTQEVYEKYRIGGKLDKAVQGVKNIVAWKKKLKSITPFVEIQFIVFKTNEHQMRDMKRLAKSLHADRLVFKTAQLYDFENGHELLTSIDKYARYKMGNDGKYHIKNKLENRCLRLWSGAVVNANGDLVPCCFDKNTNYAFGNIGTKDFSTVWHNKRASDFRESILQNRKQYEMCRNCTSK